MKRSSFAVGIAIALAGCGGIDSPDLGSGQVRGQLTGAAPGAYAYALGAPQTKVLLGPDGSFTLSAVPIGAAQIVLFDGSDRAELLPVEVKPASRSRLDHDASAMPLAGKILVTARCAGGASGEAARFTVDGTDLEDVGDPGGSITLSRLPPGSFTVHGSLAGFRSVPATVTVTSGASLEIEIDMDVEEGEAQPGCLSSGCSNGLRCGGDGKCYQCASDADCGSGLRCEDHLCASESGGGRGICEPVTSASQCESGLAVTMGGTTLYCSRACATAQDCPSGYGCQGGACVAPEGCSGLLQDYGQACLKDEFCRLVDPRCFRPDEASTGYCTSRCDGDADCPTIGSQIYTCDPHERVCVHP